MKSTHVEISVLHSVLKRGIDVVISLMALALLLPLLLVIGASIKLDSAGPIFFVQKRLGKNRNPFNIIKFRTMIDKAEKVGTGLTSYSDDPRVTRVGKMLRTTSLDELPQLVNILLGDMSFVGPRPPVVYELGDERLFTPLTRRRFIVRPGVTGLAQVHGRNQLTWDKKIKYDNIYIDAFSRGGICVDMKIALRTVFVVVFRVGVHDIRGKVYYKN